MTFVWEILPHISVRIAPPGHSRQLYKPDCVECRSGNALAGAALPANTRAHVAAFEGPHKLQECCGLLAKPCIEARDSGEATLGQRKLTFCDTALHPPPHRAQHVP